MKYIPFFIVLCTLTSNIFAFDGSKVRINVSANSNMEYLCVSQLGCINISQAHGRAFPLNSGQVSYIFLANGRNYRMYPQALPNSCNVAINNNQTLVVSGVVSKAANDNMHINGLRCAVVNG